VRTESGAGAASPGADVASLACPLASQPGPRLAAGVLSCKLTRPIRGSGEEASHFVSSMDRTAPSCRMARCCSSEASCSSFSTVSADLRRCVSFNSLRTHVCMHAYTHIPIQIQPHTDESRRTCICHACACALHAHTLHTRRHQLLRMPTRARTRTQPGRYPRRRSKTRPGRRTHDQRYAPCHRR
jgi:hypothetical protein